MISFYSSCGCTKLDIVSLEDVKIVEREGVYTFNTTCCGDFYDKITPEMLEKEKVRIYRSSIHQATKLFEEEQKRNQEIFYRELEEFADAFDVTLDRTYIVAQYGEDVLPSGNKRFVANYNVSTYGSYEEMVVGLNHKTKMMLKQGYAEIQSPQQMNQGMLLEKCFQLNNSIRYVGCWSCAEKNTERYLGECEGVYLRNY